MLITILILCFNIKFKWFNLFIHDTSEAFQMNILQTKCYIVIILVKCAVKRSITLCAITLIKTWLWSTMRNHSSSLRFLNCNSFFFDDLLVCIFWYQPTIYCSVLVLPRSLHFQINCKQLLKLFYIFKILFNWRIYILFVKNNLVNC